ncbi:Oligogalacturonate lyase [compost metagenome]
MAKGMIFPPESVEKRDSRTGARIRQITSHPSIHHQPFFMVPAYDDAMRYLFFISHRTGAPQLFAENRETRELVQLTDRDNLSPWSVHPSHDGHYVYFTAGSEGWRLHMKTLEEELLLDLNQGSLRTEGMVAAAMGTTALSRNDRWWAFRYSQGGMAHLAIFDTDTKQLDTILSRDDISHLQFCPDDPELLFYAGPLTDRVWAITRDGRHHRRLYQRNPASKEWITHESWIPGTRELAFIDWPHGIRCVHADSGAVRTVTSLPAWHAICNRAGNLMVADTNFPDIGLHLFNPRDGIGTATALCYPEASSLGEHWDGPFPYDNGPVTVYAPQHTHPHPSFSPDSRKIIYTSDRSGFSQLYEVDVP